MRSFIICALRQILLPVRLMH